MLVLVEHVCPFKDQNDHNTIMLLKYRPPKCVMLHARRFSGVKKIIFIRCSSNWWSLRMPPTHTLVCSSGFPRWPQGGPAPYSERPQTLPYHTRHQGSMHHTILRTYTPDLTSGGLLTIPWCLRHPPITGGWVCRPQHPWLEALTDGGDGKHCDNEEMNMQGKGLWWPQGIGNWRVCLTMRGLSGSDISPLPGLMCPSAYCVFHIGAPINSRVGAIVPQYLPIPKPSSHPVWASFPPPPTLKKDLEIEDKILEVEQTI